MESTDLQTGFGYADSARATSSLKESWRPGGDSNPRSVPSQSAGDVENRSLLIAKTPGSDPAIQSPANLEIPALALPPQPALAGGAPAASEPSCAAGGPGSDAHHSHHWVLPSPDGPYAHARCKHCNAERDFPNFFVGLTISDHKGGAEFMAPIEPSGIARYIP